MLCKLLGEQWKLVLAAFAVCAALGPVLIPFLHKLKFGQSIRDCGPESHMKKSGTPTMGGLMIMAGLVIAVALVGKLTPAVLIALFLTLGHCVIGFLDDFIKVVMKRNLGLTAKQKMALQLLMAAAYIYYAVSHSLSTAVWIPGVNAIVDIGPAYYFFVVLLLVGTTNAVNLTDGLDGLVSFVTLPVALAFGYIAASLGQQDLAGFAMAMLGACAGFLVYNHHPAKVFMGDTGSLALGGGIAALALLTKTELLLVLLGGVYVAETMSVIIQVSYFKYTGGKRIFRMSPLHHHYELGGWKETKVVAVFTAVSCLLAVLSLLLWNLK